MGFEVEIKHIWATYRMLKTYAYFENLNLFLKARVAKFENTHVHKFSRNISELETQNIDGDARGDSYYLEYGFEDFQLDLNNSIDHPFNQIVEVLNCNIPTDHPSFRGWLDEINYRLITKNVRDNRPDPSAAPLFLTNDRTANLYEIDKVNYFIDAPVELHIIEILWTLLVGGKLDQRLNNNCFGNRLSDHAKIFEDRFYNSEEVFQHHGELFNRYVEQYNSWRDGALNTTKDVVKSGENAAIFSLDLKSYFYNIDIDYNYLEQTVYELEKDSNKYQLATKLCSMLKEINIRYSQVVYPFLSSTHKNESTHPQLPIGFASSSLLSNWYLNDLDHFISQTIRPAYYGRYVDDLIFVFKDPIIETENVEDTIDEFVNRYFKNALVKEGEKNGNYRLTRKYNSLPVQRDKLILHYFDKKHTLAGLEGFQQELEERSSAFRFLPDDHIVNDLEKFAYDVLYDGSVNKFRSVVGLAENETELSKYLSSHIIAHRLCQIKDDQSPIPKIKSFFKGVNALRFSRLWEKVFSYAIIKGENEQFEFARTFYLSLQKLIENTTYKPKFAVQVNEEITEKLRTDLGEYLSHSVCMPLALLGVDYAKGKILKHEDPKWIFSYRQQIEDFRASNLFRHSYVAWPLMNYTRTEGNLCDPNLYKVSESAEIIQLQKELSPRFVHFEEWQVLNAHTRLHSKIGDIQFDNFAEDTSSSYSKYWFKEEFPIEITKEARSGCKVNKVKIKSEDLQDSSRKKLKIAIANLRVSSDDISNAFRRDGAINLSIDRQRMLWNLLDEAERNNVKLLVLPEVSVPVSWLPFMVSHARRKQIGLIFGLEHWVVKNVAYNLIVEAFPFTVSEKYKSCLVTLRVKNHYSPEEKRQLEAYRIVSGEPPQGEWVYNLVNWAGIQLSSYNCFELANIEHRSLFRSELDLLVGCVWNKDTNYYDHILESAVRDLFCYVIQANTSQYGGSCVLKPSRSFEAQIIKVKGGDNGCILTTDLDISALRGAQHQSIRDKGDYSFKATPPGYNHDEVLKR